tara:strand:- start:3251 stop:3439 length:189 start_codon:yes stop_codon:yes gene_type:complete
MKDKKKFDLKILDIIVCPATKQKITFDEKNNQLISKKAKLAYPIKEGIPILLVEEAIKIKDL